jgi:hypothetical protein
MRISTISDPLKLTLQTFADIKGTCVAVLVFYSANKDFSVKRAYLIPHFDNRQCRHFQYTQHSPSREQ